jgi:uncharacterized protein YndB with AHSA1/START domain
MDSENKILSFEREFDAPRQLIWDVWTKPEHFSKWYAPEHFTIPICELDVRPGGTARIDMQGPDGIIYPSIGTFKEVVKPELLSFTNSPLDGDDNKLFEVLHTLVLTENGTKTRFNLTSKVLWAGPQAGPYLAGMEPGLNQALVKLSEVISSL